jgi:hypothetical protein
MAAGSGANLVDFLIAAVRAANVSYGSIASVRPSTDDFRPVLALVVQHLYCCRVNVAAFPGLALVKLSAR